MGISILIVLTIGLLGGAVLGIFSRRPDTRQHDVFEQIILAFVVGLSLAGCLALALAR